ncbi:transmembrane amino acid transporter protein-domain-containing protein [Obelidium mucronatum]|nr:transmembrane amino acid transporter protein-domain-containing protein [Obelidium mucronatum]
MPLSIATDAQTAPRVRSIATPVLQASTMGNNYASLASRDADDPDDEEDLYHGGSSEATGTIMSSTVNITNTILGSGMLAMPKALASTGLGFGSLLIALSGLASAFGLTLLTHCASKIGRHSSFFQISKLTYPQAAIWFDLAIAIKCFGVSISYLVIIGDLLPTVMHSLYPDSPPHSVIFSKQLWITLSMVLLIPVAFAKQLNSLRYTSMLALCAVVYLVGIVFSYFVSPLPAAGMPKRPEWNEITWVKVDSSFFKILPIFVFAFTCHQNIFAVHNELDDNAIPRVSRVIHLSITTAFSVYQLIGIMGYLTFGNSVAGNVISMYPPGALITGGQISLAILFLLSYPLQCHPARASLEKVLTGGNTAIQMTEFRFTAITTGLLVGSYLIAISVDDLSTVLSLVGATGSTAICYILPGVLYYKLRMVTDPADVAKKWDSMKVSAVGLAVFGCFFMVLSVGTQVWFILRGGGEKGGGGGH